MVEQLQDPELQRAGNWGYSIFVSYVALMLGALAYVAADVVGML